MRAPRVRLYLAVIAIAVGVVEYGLGPHLSWLLIKPDLTLVFAVLAGLVFGPRDGAVAGLFAGIIPDVWGGRYIGVITIVHAAMGLVAGLAEQRVFKENITVPLGAGVLGTIIGDTMALLLYRVLGVPLPGLVAGLTVIFRGALYNAILAPFIYVVLLRLRSAVRAAGAPEAHGKRNA